MPKLSLIRLVCRISSCSACALGRQHYVLSLFEQCSIISLFFNIKSSSLSKDWETIVECFVFAALPVLPEADLFCVGSSFTEDGKKKKEAYTDRKIPPERARDPRETCRDQIKVRVLCFFERLLSVFL